MKNINKAPFAPSTIQEAYEARPRLWWLYTLILLILVALLGWSGSSVHFKGFANKGTRSPRALPTALPILIKTCCST